MYYRIVIRIGEFIAWPARQLLISIRVLNSKPLCAHEFFVRFLKRSIFKLASNLQLSYSP